MNPDLQIASLAPVFGQPARSRSCGLVGAGESIAIGDLCMAVDGVAWLARGSTGLAGLLNTLSSKIPGADANGAVILRSTGRAKIAVQFLTGTSKTLGIDGYAYAGGQWEVRIQLGTDGGGLVTTTALVCAAFINDHPRLRDAGLRAVASGDGTGLCALAALTAVSLVGLLGWATGAYNNSASGSNATVELTFAIGSGIMSAASVTRLLVPCDGRVTNHTTVTTIYSNEFDIPIRIQDYNGTKAQVQVD